MKKAIYFIILAVLILSGCTGGGEGKTVMREEDSSYTLQAAPCERKLRLVRRSIVWDVMRRAWRRLTA